MALRASITGLTIRPLIADFTTTRALPLIARREAEARLLLRLDHRQSHPRRGTRLSRQCRAAARRRRASSSSASTSRSRSSILLPAYNDAKGVTAAFNLNLLARINRELGGDFDLTRFAHDAVYDEAARPHRDVSGEPCAAERACARAHLRLRRRRAHPHRELAQIYGRRVPGARERLGWQPVKAWTDPGPNCSACISCGTTSKVMPALAALAYFGEYRHHAVAHQMHRLVYRADIGARLETIWMPRSSARHVRLPASEFSFRPNVREVPAWSRRWRRRWPDRCSLESSSWRLLHLLPETFFLLLLYKALQAALFSFHRETLSPPSELSLDCAAPRSLRGAAHEAS